MDFLVVGLGNPGKEYELTRHNIGFIVLDNFADKAGIEISKSAHKGILGKGEYLDNNLYLFKPLTFMNRSGEAIKEVRNFYKIPVDHMIVIQDELDLLFGDIRYKFGGGTAGHNGLKSIVENIGDTNFHRIRIGIGKPEYKTQVVNHVLSTFSEDEFKVLDGIIGNAIEDICSIITGKKIN